MADFMSETMEGKRQWGDRFKIMNGREKTVNSKFCIQDKYPNCEKEVKDLLRETNEETNLKQQKPKTITIALMTTTTKTEFMDSRLP